MNESWAYNPTDPEYKSPRRLIHTLCEVAGKGWAGFVHKEELWGVYPNEVID